MNAMIGKQQWNEMALQVHELEKRMQKTYTELAQNVSEPGVKAIFTKLVQDEQNHANAIDAIANKIMKS
jgi:rubrerythrin